MHQPSVLDEDLRFGIQIRIQPVPPVPPTWCHEVFLEAPLPHTRGVRIDGSYTNSFESNIILADVINKRTKFNLRELVLTTVIFAPGASRTQVRTGPVWTISADEMDEMDEGDAVGEFREAIFRWQAL